MTTATTTRDADRLTALADRADLTDLVARQGRWLDQRRFDETDTIFTADATVSTPGGRSAGRDALAEQARRVHTPYAATQHFATGVLVEVAGDRATVEANLVATFVGDGPAPVLTVAERARYEAVRTPAGWRFSHFEVTPVWHVGDRPRPA